MEHTFTLYKRSRDGKEMVWMVTVKGDRYTTTAGYLYGALTESKPTVAKPTNVGKANERNAEDQAEFEARALVEKRIKQGFVHDMRDMDKPAPYFVPAHCLEIRPDRMRLFPRYAQPKLDGIKCIAMRSGLYTRNGNKIVCCPHIEEAYKPIFEAYPELVFDGELYNHNYHHNIEEIVSLTRKIKPTELDLQRSREIIQHHVYDGVPSDTQEGLSKGYAERMGILREACARYLPKDEHLQRVVFVETVLVSTRRQLENAYQGYLRQNYEGIILREQDGRYVHGDTRTIEKLKPSCDAEFPIVRVEEGIGNRTGMAGRIWCAFPDGREFPCAIMGNEALYARMLRDSDKLVGKKATVLYQNKTNAGELRHPRVKVIRDYE